MSRDIRWLLNYSTQQGDLRLFENNWQTASAFLRSEGFDGFELYPVFPYDFSSIPHGMTPGLHLRFFIFLRELWQGDNEALLQLFGDWPTLEHFYGGRTKEALISAYHHQLELAAELGCHYVVFHPVHVALDHIHDWKFPYRWEETVDLCAELLNAALEGSRFSGRLLFENLWWPGSFTLRNAGEYERLRRRVRYENCGIAFDTAHFFNSGTPLTDEKEAVERLLSFVKNMGGLAREICTVHLVSSLSGDYIRTTRSAPPPDWSGLDFWQRFERAREHVNRIDPHLPFTSPYIAELFDCITPEHVVFEFSYRDLEEWQSKIQRQKASLATLFPRP